MRPPQGRAAPLRPSRAPSTGRARCSTSATRSCSCWRIRRRRRLHRAAAQRDSRASTSSRRRCPAGRAAVARRQRPARQRDHRDAHARHRAVARARHPDAAEIDSFGDDGRPLAGVLAARAAAARGRAHRVGRRLARAARRGQGPRASRLEFLVGAIDAIAAAPRRSRAALRVARPVPDDPRRRDAGARVRRADSPRHRSATPRRSRRPSPTRAAVMDEPLPPPRPLSARQRSALIDIARATLAVLARETDPVTWPSRDGVRSTSSRAACRSRSIRWTPRAASRWTATSASC